MMTSIHKTLNIGHRAFKDYPERTGGVVVLFESWLEYCREQSMPMDVIDANSHNYSSPFSLLNIIKVYMIKNYP